MCSSPTVLRSAWMAKGRWVDNVFVEQAYVRGVGILGGAIGGGALKAPSSFNPPASPFHVYLFVGEYPNSSSYRTLRLSVCASQSSAGSPRGRKTREAMKCVTDHVVTLSGGVLISVPGGNHPLQRRISTGNSRDRARTNCLCGSYLLLPRHLTGALRSSRTRIVDLFTDRPPGRSISRSTIVSFPYCRSQLRQRGFYRAGDHWRRIRAWLLPRACPAIRDRRARRRCRPRRRTGRAPPAAS